MMYKPCKMMYLTLMSLLISVPSIALSAVDDGPKLYKRVHEDGSVTYSDQASPESTEITLNVPTSTIQSKKQSLTPQAITSSKQKTQYQISVVSPQDGETIRSNQGELSIVTTIEPKINGFFRLNINDQVKESATGIFQLVDMHRGSYQYIVKFIDNSGKVIASSENRTLYLHQASALIN